MAAPSFYAQERDVAVMVRAALETLGEKYRMSPRDVLRAIQADQQPFVNEAVSLVLQAGQSLEKMRGK